MLRRPRTPGDAQFTLDLTPIPHAINQHQVDNSGVAMALGDLIPASPDKIYGGSHNPRIQALVIEIDDLYIQANIDRRTFWVPRNQIADYLTMVSTGDHYSICCAQKSSYNRKTLSDRTQ